MRRWDVIVIGSGPGGPGGLTAAVALARRGLSVLVLEQHYLPGGWTHSFTLEGYRFSPGVHYLGEMHPGGSMRNLLEGLGLGEDLVMREMNPDGYDHYRIGDARFDVPRGFDRYLQRLLARFPHERQGLLRYHQVLDAVLRDVQQVDRLLEFPDVLRVPFRVPTLLRWGFRSLSSLLDRCITDPLLKAVLTAQAGNYGLPPSQVSLPMHAGMHFHYHDGAFFPQGGGRALPRAFIRELRRRRSDIRMRARVTSIVVEGGRATGVRLNDGETLHADHVVSNADPAITYGQLLPPAHRGRFARLAERMTYSFSCVSLFSAVDLDLRALGFDSGNVWLYRHGDMERFYRGVAARLPTSIDGMFVSFPTLKDPTYRPRGHHTVEAFTFVPWEPFARWQGLPPGARDEGYERLKRHLGEQMTEVLDGLIPGYRRHLAFSSVATPLANAFYVNVPRGAIFGTAKTPGQIGPLSFSTTSPVPNLFHCGGSILSHGVAGGAFSGLLAAAKLLGVAADDLLGAPDGSLTVLPAEAPPLPRRRPRGPEAA